MKVLHITFSDGHGGADIAAARLNKALNEWGESHKDRSGDVVLASVMLVQDKRLEEPSIYTFGKIDCKILQVLRRKADICSTKNRDKRLGIFSSFTIRYNKLRKFE